MDFLSQVLPIIINFLLIALLFIGIIIGIKIIITMNKVERIVNDVENKIKVLDGVFNILEAASGKITGIYERVIDFAGSIVDKLFFSKKNGKDEDYE